MANDASGTAVGLWKCELPSEKLAWSPVVRQLFGIAPEADLRRQTIVEMYADGCRERMQAVRAYGIRSGNGFSLDASIWIDASQKRRVHIDGKVFTAGLGPRRLVGTKRDITALHAAWREARNLPGHDAVTGLPGTFAALQQNGLHADGRLETPCLRITLEGLGAMRRDVPLAGTDEVLKCSADRIRHLIEALGTACVPDSGSFLVLIKPEAAHLLSRIGTRLATALREPIFWKNRLIFPEFFVERSSWRP